MIVVKEVLDSFVAESSCHYYWLLLVSSNLLLTLCHPASTIRGLSIFSGLI